MATLGTDMGGVYWRGPTESRPWACSCTAQFAAGRGVCFAMLCLPTVTDRRHLKHCRTVERWWVSFDFHDVGAGAPTYETTVAKAGAPAPAHQSDPRTAGPCFWWSFRPKCCIPAVA